MATATLPPPPRQTANPSPVRPLNSVRRTCTIDVSWPDGIDGQRLFIGRARDLRTDASGATTVIGQGEMRARLTDDKEITAISAEPPHANIERFIGQHGGGHLRMFIRESLPELIASADPLYLALDDISGTALVSAFAWSQWFPDWTDRIRGNYSDEEFEQMMTKRVNVCWGLAEGNSGVQPGGPPRNVADADAGELRNPADPEGWHPFPENDGPGFRRARRIDVTLDEAAGLIRVDGSFQDSARRKIGGRVAIHEYDYALTIDRTSGNVLTLDPTPRILPFSECPGAVANARRMIGTHVDDIRDEVLAQLRGPQGCTHLNDVLRSLADVPALAGHLEAAS